jgi:tRNA dimethylallyltransferase
MNQPLLVAVVGPTGSGKSHLALDLAETLGGEIVNCDSLQLYRLLEIGTAKPTLTERRGIPHHLLDVLNPDQVFSAGDFRRAAEPVLRDIAARGRLPILCGGTGFYLRALLEGLFAGPPRDEALRAQLVAAEARRPGLVHRYLRRLDPAGAQRIHARDVQKAIRAVEISRQARQPATSLYGLTEQPLQGFRILTLGLDPPRTQLYERINRRVEQMFERGLLDEVRAILAAGYPPDAKALESIGYQQALAVLQGRLSLAAAIADTQIATRRYAKRQWTWFRRDPAIRWIPAFGSDSPSRRLALDAITGQ